MDTNDRFTDATTKSSSSNSSNHTIDIIKAAFPFLDSDLQQSANLVIKTGELMDTFHEFEQEETVTAFSLQKQSIDFESLLNGVRTVCNQKETELIDMILNIFKAKNLYSTYTTLASVMAPQTGNDNNASNLGNLGNLGGLGNLGNLGSILGMDGNSNVMELLSSFLTPEQKDTFDNLSMMMSVMQ